MSPRPPSEKRVYAANDDKYKKADGGNVSTTLVTVAFSAFVLMLVVMNSPDLSNIFTFPSSTSQSATSLRSESKHAKPAKFVPSPTSTPRSDDEDAKVPEDIVAGPPPPAAEVVNEGGVSYSKTSSSEYEFTGWKKHVKMDVRGSFTDGRLPLDDPRGCGDRFCTLGDIKVECGKRPSCQGFNSFGQLKLSSSKSDLEPSRFFDFYEKIFTEEEGALWNVGEDEWKAGIEMVDADWSVLNDVTADDTPLFSHKCSETDLCAPFFLKAFCAQQASCVAVDSLGNFYGSAKGTKSADSLLYVKPGVNVPGKATAAKSLDTAKSDEPVTIKTKAEEEIKSDQPDASAAAIKQFLSSRKAVFRLMRTKGAVSLKMERLKTVKLTSEEEDSIDVADLAELAELGLIED